MADDLLGGIFGDIVLGGPSGSRRAQLLFRLFFGVTTMALRAGMVAVFVFLGCFSLFNIALARAWRWPARPFILSFVALVAARLLFGR